MPEKEKLFIIIFLNKKRKSLFLNKNERDGGTESRNIRQHVKICDKLRFSTQNSNFLLFYLLWKCNAVTLEYSEASLR